MNRSILVSALGAAAAMSALSNMQTDIIGGGPSRSELELDRERRAAKRARETWENPPEGESRQVRRARERRERAR